MTEKIEKLRKELDSRLENGESISSLLKLSKELDEAIDEFYRAKGGGQ